MPGLIMSDVFSSSSSEPSAGWSGQSKQSLSTIYTHKHSLLARERKEKLFWANNKSQAVKKQLKANVKIFYHYS